MMGSAGKLLLLAVACIFASSPVHALPGLGASGPIDDPTPSAANAVRAVFATEILDSLEGFEIHVDLEVFEMEIPPAGGHTASEVRAAPRPLQELFEGGVRATIEQEAKRVLPDADVSVRDLSFDYGAEDFDEDPYHPGIAIHALVRADFTPEFFGLPAGVSTPPSDLARAFLYSGGVYAITKELQVPAGYDVRHVVGVPEFLELQEPGTLGKGRLEFHKNNFNGAEPRAVRLDFNVRLREDALPANVLAGPLVRATFIVDDATPLWRQAVPFVAGEYVGDLDLEIQVHSLSSELFGTYPLPRQLGLSDISADLLRIAIDEGLVQRTDVQQFFENLIRRSLEQGFGEGIALGFDWATFDRTLNQGIGGADGRSVEPVVVRAQAVLPFESNKMLVSSSLGRLVSMTVGSSGSFELNNEGMWNAEYTVAYPEGVHVRVDDSAGIVEDMNWGAREGFHVYLEKGASTKVHVSGRSDPDPVVFSIGVLELGVLLGAAWFLWKRFRGFRERRAAVSAV